MNIGFIVGCNIIFAIIAYLVGSLNFSIIITKHVNRKDIRELGSKNAGSTNVLRNFGKKTALIVFLLDVSKSFWIGVVGALLRDHVDFFWGLITPLAMFFVIVGHIWPVFFKFKGGKGAATNLGLISASNIILSIIGFFLFSVIVLKTKMVSLGSIIVPYILAFIMIIPFFNNYFPLSGIVMTNFINAWYIPILFLFFSSFLITFTHRGNIKKIIMKQENKLNLKKNNKKN